MRSAPFENGKQVGVWTTYDAKGKGRQIDEDEGPGLNWPARRGAVLLRSKGGAENLRPASGIHNLRCIFHRGGVRWGCPEFRCGWRWILTTSMPKLSTRGLPKSGCR